ncbi:tetratricopeptide repeat protein [Parablastomonas sp. CN1-191]|uniref:tetratricopeptide repeat protein n=1 Tax=Parablastomonas sp. CN1-191 TaxID=3400908 RepID=UPI003BF81932
MSLAIAGLAAAAAFALAVFALGAPRRTWEAIASALLFGLAGYALQGHRDLPGSPRAPTEASIGNPALLVETRQALQGDGKLPANRWVLLADAMVRNGRYGDAADTLRVAVGENPRDAEAWLALGNALVGHAGGQLTPAALMAYDRAAEIDPAGPGPRFFRGLALLGSGRIVEGRKAWADLLASAPANAPWRAGLADRVARLDAMIAAAGADSSR